MRKTLLLFLIISVEIFAQRWWMVEDEPIDRTVYAVSMNGTNEYARKTSFTTIDLEPDTSITIMYWTKTANVTNDGYDISMRLNTFDYFLTHSLFAQFNDATNHNAVSGVTQVNDTWYHVAVRMDADSLKIFINGIRKGAGLAIDQAYNDSQVLNIGAWSQIPTSYSNATIGEVQIILGYALTPAEINQAYVRGLNGLHYQDSYLGGRIVAWYKWAGEDNTTFLQDESSYNNDLTGTNVTQADDQVILNGGYK